MKYFTFAAFIMIATQMAYAESTRKGFFEAASNTNWGTEEEVNEPVTSTLPEEPEFTSSGESDTVCMREDQTTLSQRMIQVLLFEKHKINGTPFSNLIKVSGGDMIGNCDSMISFEFSKPSENKYNSNLLQVNVNKPTTGCEDVEENGITKTFCDYKVIFAEDGTANKEETHSFEPNYYGFMECLKKAGVYDEAAGVFHKDKIAAKPLDEGFKGAVQTGDYEIYCHGPECKKDRLQDESSQSGNSCEWVEKIKNANGDKITFYSQADIAARRKEADFKAACNLGNYREVLEASQQFDGPQYATLVEVSHNLLHEKIKELTQAFRKKKDLSKYSSSELDDLYSAMEDFNEHILSPLKNRIANLIVQIEEASTDEKADALRDKLDGVFALYAEYVSGDYFGANDYERMKNMEEKPPLKQKAWREMALSLYKNLNAVYNFSRVTNSNLEKEEDEQLAELYYDEIIEEMAAAVKKEKRRLNQLGYVASNPGTSKYSDDHYQSAQVWTQEAQEVLTDMTADYKQGAQTLQQCVMLQNAQCVQAVSQRLDTLDKDIAKTKKYYEKKISSDQKNYNEWSKIEKTAASWNKNVTWRGIASTSNTDFTTMSFADILARTTGQGNTQTLTGNNTNLIQQLLARQQSNPNYVLNNGQTTNTGINWGLSSQNTAYRNLMLRSGGYSPYANAGYALQFGY